jgi:general secretion pathway protein D
LIKIIPDERTNSLIILANDEDTQRVINLVKRLDVETERTRIHVYFLKNSNSEDMAKALSSIVSKRKPKGKEEVPLISEDKPTNSLIIDATQEDYADLTKIIKKLDVIRDQVLVEVLIAEVRYEKTFELGVEWKSVGNNGTANNGYPTYDNIKPGRSGAQGYGGSTWSSGGLINYLTPGEGPVTAGAGLALGFVQKIAGKGSSLPDFAVLLHALQTNKDANVLATPQVLTMDNEEASIKIGKNIPYMTKYEVGTSGSNSAQNIDYKDIGIDMKITPHISKEKMVRLENDISISVLSGEQVAGITRTPTTTIREAKNSVLVKDNHTIVIGGMIQDNKIKTVDKIPILGDIPLLGLLFQTRSTKTEKLNLLIFITPRVVKTTQQVADLTKFKRHQMKEIDQRLDEVERETAESEYKSRARKHARNRDLKSRYGKVYSGPPAGAEPGLPARVKPVTPVKAQPAPPAEAKTVPPAKTKAAPPAAGVRESKSSSGSLLEKLPKISFSKKEEEKKGTRAQKRGRQP